MTIVPPIGWIAAGRRLWRRAPRWRSSVMLAVSFSLLSALYSCGPAIPHSPGTMFGRSDLRVGQTVRRLVTIGGKTVPLPKGDWRVLAVQSAPRLNRVDDVRIETAALSRGATPTLTGLLVLTTNMTPSTQGYRADGECERSDLNFTEVTSNVDFGQQDCRVIDFLDMTKLEKLHPDDILGDAARALQQQHWNVPTTMVGASFRFGSQQQLLLAQYFFNPDEEGISPTRDPAWSESDWNRYNIAKFPEKQAYLDRVMVWMRQWYVFVQAGFENRLPSDSGLSSDTGP